MNEELAKEIVLESRKIRYLTKKQIGFLVNWAELSGGKFGFREIKDTKEQIKEAIKFYLKQEKEWQKATLGGMITGSLPTWIVLNGQEEGIDFPDGFVLDMITKLKEWK